jgi:hypothetical protein
MKRLFSLRVLVWTFASLATLYILAVTLENWTGARALAAAKERIVKEGESLDFMALVPPLPPEAENFCALEPLAGLTNPKNKPAQALEALDKITSKAPGGLNSIQLGTAPDLKPWIEHLAKSGIGKADATPAEMLIALDAAHPVLKTLADAAPQSRAAQFTPRIGEGLEELSFFGLPMPHYNHAMRLAKALLLRCNLALAAGNAAEAVRCIQASLRLAHGCFQDPVLIGLLVGSTIHATTMDRVWALLHARIASEAELNILRDELTRLDLLASMLHAMRGELAGAAQTFNALRGRPNGVITLFDVSRPPGTPQPVSSRVLNAMLPSGFLDHSEAVVINLAIDHLILPMKQGGYLRVNAGFHSLETNLAGKSRIGVHPHHIFARLLMPAYRGVIRGVTESEARRRQALAAVAIESVRLAKGSPPESLPAGILDVIDEKPMRYRVEGGGYVLWSIAQDEEDDGGKLPGKDEKVRDAKFTGDWVWRMPASK